MRFFCLVSALLLLIACDDYSYIIVSHSVNFISKNGRKVVPTYILEHKRGGHFITASRLKVNSYRCGTEASYYSTGIITKDIEYRVINTDTGRLYITESRDEYIRYLSQHKIKYLLTTSRYEDAPFRRNENLKEAFERGNDDVEKDILTGKCWFVAEYSG